jgi:mannan endo-1,4-beta-mannosidase
MRVLLIFLVCSLGFVPETMAQTPADPRATGKTTRLYHNLKIISQQGFMLGHQDDQAYGVGWKAEPGRSDVLETAGSYPAVHGWDIGKRLIYDFNIDTVNFDDMVLWMKEAYKRGGINTISWHLDNLTSGGNSWDRTSSVKDILPGGSKHQSFVQELDLLATMLGRLKQGFSRIPVIFRPWHEHNGGWFWWGKGNCTEQEYVQLFRFTVEYLRDQKKIHHLLYAFSPDRSQWNLNDSARENYFYGYPGDDYVDIIGLDNYGDVGRSGGPDSPELQRERFITSLKLITEIAREKDKVAALTETGLEGVSQPDWFTRVILEPIMEHDEEIDIAWVLMWRNANTGHHYAPYSGHASEPDFRVFEKNPATLFEKDLWKPYNRNKAIK